MTCQRHPCSRRNADGDCIECAEERTAEAVAEEDRLRDPTAKALSAASKALGDIMLEMQRRRLYSDPKTNRKTGEMLARDPRRLTDEQIGTLAANAFEAAVLRLAEIGYPDCTVFVCNPTEEP